MSQPPDFVDDNHPDHVCLLHKSLYGLKQAPRAWFHKLSSALLAFGFQASNYDPSLFVATHADHTLLVLVYVDDILVTGSNPSAVTECITKLQATFAVKDLSNLHYFLGIEATSSSTSILLTQTKYIIDLLSKVNMLNAKTYPTQWLLMSLSLKKMVKYLMTLTFTEVWLVRYNTRHSEDPILPSPSTRYPNSCITPLFLNGWQ